MEGMCFYTKFKLKLGLVFSIKIDFVAVVEGVCTLEICVTLWGNQVTYGSVILFLQA